MGSGWGGEERDEEIRVGLNWIWVEVWAVVVPWSTTSCAPKQEKEGSIEWRSWKRSRRRKMRIGMR